MNRTTLQPIKILDLSLKIDATCSPLPQRKPKNHKEKVSKSLNRSNLDVKIRIGLFSMSMEERLGQLRHAYTYFIDKYRQKYDESVIKTFKCLQVPSAVPGYISTKNKFKQNLLANIKKEMPKVKIYN